MFKKSFSLAGIFSSMLFFSTLVGCGSDDGGGGGSSGGGGGGSPASTPPSPVYLWRNGSAKNGNLGGVSGANTYCNVLPPNTLPSGLTHEAVLSTSSQDARDIITDSSRPVRRPDGTLIIDTWAKFFDQSETATASVWTSSTQYWTGIAQDGTPDTSNDCNNWTSAGPTAPGKFGEGNQTGNRRYSFSSTTTCNQTLYLLCVSY